MDRKAQTSMFGVIIISASTFTVTPMTQEDFLRHWSRPEIRVEADHIDTNKAEFPEYLHALRAESVIGTSTAAGTLYQDPRMITTMPYGLILS